MTPQNKTRKKKLTVVEGREINQRMVDDLREAARARGWGFRQLKHVGGRDVAQPERLDEIFTDYVIWRDLVGNNTQETERMRHFLARSGRVTVNAQETGGRACGSDKFYQHGLFMGAPDLAEHCLPMWRVRSADEVRGLVLDGLLEYPFVLKRRWGTAGKQIHLVNNEEDLARYEKELEWQWMAAEPYVEAECDWRVFVVGGVAVAAMRKRGNKNDPGDFRAKSGGVERELEEDPQIKEKLFDLACRMAEVAHHEYSGCDIIFDEKTDQFYCLETNVSAGWQNGFKETTGEDVCEWLLDWLEERGQVGVKGLPELIERYITRRIKHLPRKVQEEYKKILEWGDESEVRVGGALAEQLQRLYRQWREAPSEELKGEIKGALGMVGEEQLSWAGNFLGPSGRLKEGVVPSAYYLALAQVVRE